MKNRVTHLDVDLNDMRHFWQDYLVSANYRAKDQGNSADSAVLEEAMIAVGTLFDEHVAIEELFFVVSGLFEIPDEWFDNYYPILFDKLYTKEITRSSTSLNQPAEITDLVCNLCDYKGGSVYDPFAGVGSYIFALGALDNFFAQEIDRTKWVIAQMRLRAHNSNTKCFVNEDPISIWHKHPLVIDEKMSSTYDLIVSTPPFRLSIKERLSQFETADELFIHNGLQLLSTEGRLVGVFSPAILYSSDSEALALRKSFLEHDLLDTVILLPSRLFSGTAVETIILKFSKIKKIRGQIRFVDATKSYKSRGREKVLAVEEVFELLNAGPGQYVRFLPNEFFLSRGCRIEPAALFINSIAEQNGFKKVELRSIAKIVYGEKVNSWDFRQCRAITPSLLNGNQFKCYIDIDSLGTNTGLLLHYKVTEPVLLVDKSRFRAGFVNASIEKPVMISGGIAAFSITAEWVFIPYLCRQFSLLSENYSQGSALPAISQAAMLDMLIPFPENDSDQAVIYNAAESEYKMAKVREYGLEEMLAAQKRDFILVLRNRKHDINSYVADIRNRIRGLDKYLRKNGLDKEIYSVRQNKTVGDNMDAIISSIDLMGQYLDHIADESEYGSPVKVDLYEKLQAIEDGQNYTVHFEPDLASLRDNDEDEGKVHAFVSIATSDLDHVFLNIISNAKKHGFVDSTITDYRIEILLLYDRETDSYVVEFKNNGNPMSEGLDTSRYGTDGAKFGTTKGDGHGGAIVKNTIEHFGGSIEVINTPEQFFTVGIIIKLPRYYGE